MISTNSTKRPVRSTQPIEAFNMYGSTLQGTLVFARQYPLRSLDGYENDSQYPRIFVGFDGEAGEDLAQILQEYKTMKRELADKQSRATYTFETELKDLRKAVQRLLKPKWYHYLLFWQWYYIFKKPEYDHHT